LRSKGIRLALVTNGDAAGQRDKLRRFDLERRFDLIQIEGEHGYGKPDPRAYQAVLDMLRVHPSEAWMVGDNLHWDIAAPQRLGLYGIWHDRRGEGVPVGPATIPDRVIRAPDDILDVLE
jgi:putative hydrolase of the HAD superfamily